MREIVEEIDGGVEGDNVHAGEGFVHEEDMWLLGEGAGQEHTLLLPAGEIADGTAAEVGDAHAHGGFGQRSGGREGRWA